VGGTGRAPEPMPAHQVFAVGRLRNSLRRGELRRKGHGNFVAKRAAVRGEVVAQINLPQRQDCLLPFALLDTPVGMRCIVHDSSPSTG